jgi:hypothetical protein
MRFVALSFSMLALATVAGCSAATADSVDAVDPGQSEMLSAPSASTLVSCTDTDDPTMKALVTVDSSDRFSWQIGEMKPEVSTLADVAKTVQDGTTSYTFHLASGRFVSISMSKDHTSVSFSGLYAMCPAQTAVLESAIAPLLAATAASEAQKQTFATCQFHGEGASVPEQDTFTVRPSLDGHGAVFEEASNEDSDQTFVLLARHVQAVGNPRGSMYKGEGGVAVFAAGQHVSPVTELTVTGSSPASIQWDWQEKLPSNECQVTGAAYASSLLH